MTSLAMSCLADGLVGVDGILDKFAEFRAQSQICRFPMNVLSKKKKIVEKKNTASPPPRERPVLSDRRVVHGGSDDRGGTLLCK